MELYTRTKEQMEQSFDKVKGVILNALVKEKLIDKEVAGEWCMTHTVIKTLLAQKHLNRYQSITFSNKWQVLVR
jgi:hypothetical protein|tara:strand:- start:22082 stop:22303 length:222 start_codon:yes stop_codon:yes gene_type:complete